MPHHIELLEEPIQINVVLSFYKHFAPRSKYLAAP